MNRKTLVLTLLAVAVLAGTFWGGYHYGKTQGQRSGYQWGLKKGRVEAARQGPVQVRDAAIPLEILAETAAWGALPDGLSAEEATELTQVINLAPSPCAKEARKGLSLASSMLDGAKECPGLGDQLLLARAALSSLGAEEAVAALRVERRLQPAVEGRPSRGPADAPVVLSEWGDFECPYCVRAQKVVDQLLESRDDVRVVFKHLPLSFHRAAMPSALAAEAAAEQGRFWEMHDQLFALGKDLSSGVPASIDPENGPVAFEEQARAIGLDLDQYRRDYRSKTVYERVRSDAQEAGRIGVNGTPSFFLNGRRVRERLNSETLGLLVDKAIAEQEGRFSWDLRAPKGLGETPPEAPQ